MNACLLCSFPQSIVICAVVAWGDAYLYQQTEPAPKIINQNIKDYTYLYSKKRYLLFSTVNIPLNLKKTYALESLMHIIMFVHYPLSFYYFCIFLLITLTICGSSSSDFFAGLHYINYIIVIFLIIQYNKYWIFQQTNKMLGGLNLFKKITFTCFRENNLYYCFATGLCIPSIGTWFESIQSPYTKKNWPKNYSLTLGNISIFQTIAKYNNCKTSNIWF